MDESVPARPSGTASRLQMPFAMLCFVRARLLFTTDILHELQVANGRRLTYNVHNNLQGANVRVKVEVRQSAAAPFGRGITQLMPFRQFLRRFAAGDSSMYMTAQVRGAGGYHTAALLLHPLATHMPLSSAILCFPSTCQLTAEHLLCAGCQGLCRRAS
jgi:hypothetical protein